MQHLELVARAEDTYYSGNALYLLARVLAKDKQFNDAHACLETAIDRHFESKRATFFLDFLEAIIYY
jgi:hypothetical protein